MTTTLSPPQRFSIIIPGKPISQGNPQTFTSGGMAYPKSTRNHRNLAIHLLKESWAGRPRIEGAATVNVSFRFERPASHYLPANTRRAVRELRPDAPRFHCQKPDTDKCVRLLFDAATIAGIWADDCRVVHLSADKVWAEYDSTELLIQVAE